ncbi:unnamed protein product [Adineta ricciae]|uniref:c-SKI SMAD4-binding domain-containing protein n=1 Tax=Adineta ricciae TaxID=249248 RepID=A0A814GGC6_ADIRI|nr:unnamed protein product [Adineta ricciae]
MNTNTKRIFEHLNIFSIDYYKKQQQQQQQTQPNETKMNLTSDHHDHIPQSPTIKEEKTEHHVNNQLRISSNPPDTLDQPLLIVLDEDDSNVDDDFQSTNVTTPETKVHDDLSQDEGQKTLSSNRNLPTAKQSLNQLKHSPKPPSNSLADSKLFRQPRKPRRSPPLNDDKFIRTVVIDSTFMRQTYQQQRTKLTARRKHINTYSSSLRMSNTKSLSIDEHSHVSPSSDSILSTISFDSISDVLTVSRMGSVFYCVEDLYSKIFASLCTLDEFNTLLTKPDKVAIKQVTLSEKISIEKQLPLLKKISDIRYRLLSITSSDYLLKIKQSFLAMKNLDENEKQHRGKRIEQIVDDLRSYKRTPTPVLSKDNVSHSPMTTKRLSTDDDDDDDDDDDEREHDEEPRKRLKIVTKKQKLNETPPLAPTQFGIFIQCNGPVSCNIFSTNETVSSTTNNTETTTPASAGTTSMPKTDCDIPPKSNPAKKPNENESKQVYFEKVQQYKHVSRFHLNNEQSFQKPSVLDRAESESPSTDCHQLNKLCPSSTVLNMPIKRRILNSYNSDTSDSSPTTVVHMSTSLTNPSRCLYRSKSFSYHQQQISNDSRRSSSSPPMIYSNKEQCADQRFLPTEGNPKSMMKSKAEPIDLTDESYAMPMIVNVEENVELANQRQKMKTTRSSIPNNTKLSEIHPTSDLESHSTPAALSRPISHESSPPVLTKPTPTHHTTASSYRTPPFVVCNHQESYAYRDPSHAMPISTSATHSYSHSTNVPHNNNPYSYPYSSSTQYPVVKKARDLSGAGYYEGRPHSVAPMHPSSLTTPSSSSSSSSSSSAMPINNHHSGLPSSVVLPIVRKPNYYQQLTPEQQASIKTQASTPCRLPCCYQPPAVPQHHSATHQSTDKSLHHERLMYRSYPNTAATVVPTPTPHTFKRDPSQTPDMDNPSSMMSRKQRRIDSVPSHLHTLPPPSSTPYPSYSAPKGYFAPPPPPLSSSSPSSGSHWPSSLSSPVSNANIKPSIRYPYPSPCSAPINGMPRKTEPYHQHQQQQQQHHSHPPASVPVTVQPRRPIPFQSRPTLTTPVIAQNSSALISPPNTPHELTLPNGRTRSIDLQRAIAERGYCDVDKLPKLVVRHTKTYSTKTCDSMGQLFPTWFNEPDYRCIHCFRCDQVFTPQQFMTHVDDEHLQNEQPFSMTSIQLLTSEKMSEYKVGLWNQFCTNLTIYAK